MIYNDIEICQNENLDEEFWLKEEKYVTLIYVSLIGIIVASPFLESYISSTFVRLIELFFCSVVGFCIFNLALIRSLVGFTGWSKFLIILLVICLMQIVFRSDWSSLQGKDIFLFFLNKTNNLPYLVPLCILFLPNEKHIERISEIFFWATMLVVPLWILNSTKLVQDSFLGENIGVYLPFLGCFLLICPNEFSLKKKFVLWIIYGIYLLLMLLNARRNMVFSLSFYAFIAFYSFVGKFFESFFFRILMNAILLLLISFPAFMFVDNFPSGIFGRFENRIDEDSRSEVEMFFWADYLESPSEELAFGRGGDGAYYQEMKDEDTDEITTDRYIVETGYLAMLLKGGYIYCAVMTLLMITGLIYSIKGNRKIALPFTLLFVLFIVNNYATAFLSTYNAHSIVFWLSTSLILCSKADNDNEEGYDVEE